jgi:glycosyltransferase involved in cell wall biosynthesis
MTLTTTPSITVFFPCFNEAGTIERVARQAIAYLQGRFTDFQVIIINDGSTDATGTIADTLAAADPRVQVVHHPLNRGYGAALKSGFAAATKDLIFYTDGDGQFDLHELDHLLPLIKTYALVTGYRLERRDPLFRRINAFCWNTLVNLLFNLDVRDVNCAFKLYQRQIFDAIQLHSDGALINTEIFAAARKQGFSIAEVGVTHLPRMTGTQTGAKPAVILKAFRELFALRKKLAGAK